MSPTDDNPADVIQVTSPSIITLPTTSPLADGHLGIAQYDLDEMRAPELLFLIRHWDLEFDGYRKDAYKKALHAFGQDPSKWPPTQNIRRKHKGPRDPARIEAEPLQEHLQPTSPRKKRPKLSATRRETLMHKPEALTADSHTKRSRDTRTTTQASSLTEFINNIETVLEREKDPKELITTGTSSGGALDSERNTNDVTLHPSLEAPYSDAKPEDDIKRTLAGLLHYAKITTSVLTSTFGQEQSKTADGSNGIHFSVIPNQNRSLNTQGYSASRTKSLQLACGIVFFDPNDVPPIPVNFFERSVVLLDNMWDDRSPQWNSSSPLILSGELNGELLKISIAVIYWPKVYQNDHTPRWRSSGQSWRNYKCLVAEFRILQPSKFWTKYSSEGIRIPVSKIFAIQQRERTDIYETLVAYAREEFHQTFAENFRCRGTNQNLSTSYAIARRYLQMKGFDGLAEHLLLD